MMSELSILIPTYNAVCVSLVQSLAAQAEAVLGLKYEIIVADDGSTNAETIEKNKQINHISYCKYIINKQNMGRAGIRNFLVKQSNFSLLLFVDSSVGISRSDFLTTYLSSNNDEIGVVCGGLSPIIIDAKAETNLRYMYERGYEKANSAEKRMQNPYKSFRTTNFMARKEVMLSHPFDDNIHEYGYEDVLFGKCLSDKHVSIKHINNPVDYIIHDTNQQFIAKTEAALRTLAANKSEMKNYSELLKTAKLLRKIRLSPILNAIFRRNRNKWKATLCGESPSLFLFNIYRLGYISTLI